VARSSGLMTLDFGTLSMFTMLLSEGGNMWVVTVKYNAGSKTKTAYPLRERAAEHFNQMLGMWVSLGVKKISIEWEPRW